MHPLFFLRDRLRTQVFDQEPDLLKTLSARDDVAHLYVVDGSDQPRLAATTLVAGQPLFARFTMSYLPAASFLAELPDPHVGPPLVVVDPGSDLPATRAEGLAAGSRLSQPEVLVGAKADRRSVLNAMQRDRSLFHFAGHGVLVGADPWAAHLSLAGGDELTVEDILLARGHSRVVVLNACEGGRAVGPERMSVAHAFLLAGARTVIAASRTVDDRGAQRIMTELYRAGLAEDPIKAVQRVPASWEMLRVYGRP